MRRAAAFLLITAAVCACDDRAPAEVADLVPIDQWVCPDPQMVKLYPLNANDGKYRLVTDKPSYSAADRAFCVYPAQHK